jgi:hypothetical protein
VLFATVVTVAKSGELMGDVLDHACREFHRIDLRRSRLLRANRALFLAAVAAYAEAQIQRARGPRRIPNGVARAQWEAFHDLCCALELKVGDRCNASDLARDFKKINVK